MLVALAQMDMVFEDKKTNYKKVKQFIENASKNKADLIIFPEMTCTGFSMDCKTLSEKNHETLNYFKQLSKTYSIKICFGQIINKNNQYYNNLTIIDGENELLSYDKIHLFQKENNYYQKGNHISTCLIDDISFSAFICYDLRFPEIFQYASRQADIIIVIASWPDLRDEHWLTLLKARAIENQCYIIGVNRTGDDINCHYVGHSAIYNCYGELLNKLSVEEKLIYVDINKEDIKRSRKEINIKKDRQNDLYRQLYKQSKK